MRTKKKQPNIFEPDLPTKDFKLSEEPKPEEPSKPATTRISIALNDDGTIDIDSMRAATVEKLRQAVAGTPGIAPSFNTGGAVTEFPPMLIYSLYGGLGQLEAMIAHNLGKIPREIAEAVFPYNEQELNILVPPTSRVLSKYASDWMIRYQDEIALVGLLATITLKKINLAITMSRSGQAKVVEIPKKDELDPDVKPN